MPISRVLTVVVGLASLMALTLERTYGQSFGVELVNSLMPASGGMGGASLARPQDLQSTMMGNPATMTQMKGTQFSFSGSWVEPTVNIDNRSPLPLSNVNPYAAKSQRPGSIVGNISVTQDYTARGLPMTVGIGLLTGSGLGIDYRRETDSNGTSAEFVVLATGVGAGIQLTDRLSLGFLGAVSTATLDGVFTGVSSQTPDYNLRGTLGLSYHCGPCTTIGAFWRTEEKHNFENFFRSPVPNTPFEDVDLSLPNIFGVGLADESLLGGRLLVAVDLLYFNWDDTDLFGSLWQDQWAVNTGIQYKLTRKCRIRLGYTWAENATREVVIGDVGGIINPTAAANYIQALFPNINQNRISGGIGIKNLCPGVDVDVFAGGMFNETEHYGGTSASIESYWIGFGTTWRFGRGGCNLGVPNKW